LVLWTSFAYGLPAEALAAEGEAEAPAMGTESAEPPAAAEEGWNGVTPSTVTEPAGALNATGEPNSIQSWFYLGLGYWANSSVNVNYGRYRGVLCATLNDYGTLDIGLLFGYCPFPTLAIAAGVAWVRVGHFFPYYNPIFPGSGHVEYAYTVGVPVEIQFTPIKGRVVGLALVGHGNFNKEKIFGGATIGIELGKLK